jgi:hypothetical protein
LVQGLSACTSFDHSPQEFFVPKDFLTIQEAIDFALPGEQVLVSRGVYSPSTNGELFPIFMKDGVDVIGEDLYETIIDAENTDYVLDLFFYDRGIVANLTVSGGLAQAGGGILIEDSRGRMENVQVIGNRAEVSGSGIFVLNSQGFALQNMIIAFNTRRFFDDSAPAQVELENSFLNFNNNVVAYGDSDGLLVFAGADGDFQNNIFFENGSGGFGVGFADLNEFSASTVQFNLFFGNEENDFFLNGVLLTAAEADDFDPSDRIDFNFNGDPLFTDPAGGDFTLRPGSPAIHAGNPDPAFNNPDGSRNDIGAFGGPGAI